MYKEIDLDNWARKDLFLFFHQFDDPTWDIMADVDITSFYASVLRKQQSFFLSFLYVATKACNSIDALRQRINDEGKVIEFDLIHPGSTILYDNETFGFGYFQYQDDMRAFLKDAARDFEMQKSKKDLDPRDEDLARYYFSPIPWISFSAFRHPFLKKANHSIPRIVFGKHYERDGRRYLPVGITLHHGLADGFHAGLFFTRLQELVDRTEEYFSVPDQL